MTRLAHTTSRSQWRNPFQGLDQDVRYAARTLLSARAFSLWVFGSLLVGIAVTAAAFLHLNAVLFRAIPGVIDQHRLVGLDLRRGCGRPDCSIGSSTVEDYRDLRAGLTLLDGALAATTSAIVAVTIDGRPQSLRASLVSENYLPVLGVRPVLGRSFVHLPGSPPEHAVIIRPWPLAARVRR